MDGKQHDDLLHEWGDKEKGKEINLKALYVILRKRLWLIALTTIGLTVLAGLYNARPETPLYASSSRIIVAASPEMMSTLKVMLREPIVLDKVVQELGLPRSAGQLRSQLRAESVEGSLVTVVTAVDPDAKLAAEIANATVRIYREVAGQMLGVNSIQVLTEAAESGFTINEKSNSIVVIAFLAGLVLGAGLTFLLDSLDDSVKSKREVEELLGLTMLGHVSPMRRRDRAKQATKQKSIVARGETIGS